MRHFFHSVFFLLFIMIGAAQCQCNPAITPISAQFGVSGGSGQVTRREVWVLLDRH